MDFWSVGEQHVWQILKPAQNMEEKAKKEKRKKKEGGRWVWMAQVTPSHDKPIIIILCLQQLSSKCPRKCWIKL